MYSSMNANTVPEEELLEMNSKTHYITKKRKEHLSFSMMGNAHFQL